MQMPKGRIAADFGFLVEQSVEPHWTLAAAEFVIAQKFESNFASQAQLCVAAQELGCPFFETFAPLRTF